VPGPCRHERPYPWAFDPGVATWVGECNVQDLVVRDECLDGGSGFARLRHVASNGGEIGLDQTQPRFCARAAIDAEIARGADEPRGGSAPHLSHCRLGVPLGSGGAIALSFGTFRMVKDYVDLKLDEAGLLDAEDATAAITLVAPVDPNRRAAIGDLPAALFTNDELGIRISASGSRSSLWPPTCSPGPRPSPSTRANPPAGGNPDGSASASAPSPDASPTASGEDTSASRGTGPGTT